MDSEALPPIPTPPGQRWREFRIQVLPLFVFVVVLGGLFTLWSRFVQPIAIVGLVETNAVNVTTTQAGLLTALAVNRFDEVTNGQILGEVAPYDPEQVQAQLAAIESSINVVKARMELNELGNLDASANLRINFYIQQTLPEVAKVNVEEAKLVLDRDKMLLGGGGTESVIAKARYDADEAHLKSLRTEVAHRTKVVEQSSKEVDELGPLRTNVYAQLERVIKDDILKQQDQLRQLQKPILLRAPIDGKVTLVLHRTGERVVSGAPILGITSGHAERIVAYVRQPLNFHPKVGDILTVRTRTTRRRMSDAQIVKVGTQLESVNPMLLPLDRPRPELGLPIALTLPPELNLLPGEIVDLRFSRN